MHGLKNGGVGANVGPWSHAQSAHEPRHQVGQDVTEEIGGHDHVELLWIQHQLHGTGIDDDRFHPNAALIFQLVKLLRGLEEYARQCLHYIGLVDDGDLLATRRNRVGKGVVEQATAAGAGIDAGGHRNRMRVIIDLHEVLVADVESFEILADDDQVDILEAASGDERSSGTQIRVEFEL